jgi:tripeptide aminopeptidase
MTCLELAVEIQQIPAPTFAEHARAGFVMSRLLAAGISEVLMEEHDGGIVNVYARIPGVRSGGPALLVRAHTDTVFPAGTDLAVRDDESGRLHGPGIGDNSVAVAALVVLAERLNRGNGSLPPCDVWFVANAAEEGLGDLKGIRAAIGFLTRRGDAALARPASKALGAAVVIEGMALGSIYHRGIAVQRCRVTVETGGGHSWGDFGTPSAIHVLMQIGAGIAALEVPAEPRTTFNIGLISGGTSVNTIAASATAEIDLRSESTAQVTSLEKQVLEIIGARRTDDVAITVEPIGNRPAGAIERDHPLVGAAVKALESTGVPPRFPNGSTDANALLHAGVPTVCVGVTSGANPHRSDEWIDTRLVESGVDHLEQLLHHAAQIVATSEAP